MCISFRATWWSGTKAGPTTSLRRACFMPAWVASWGRTTSQWGKFEAKVVCAAHYSTLECSAMPDFEQTPSSSSLQSGHGAVFSLDPENTRPPSLPSMPMHRLCRIGSWHPRTTMEGDRCVLGISVPNHIGNPLLFGFRHVKLVSDLTFEPQAGTILMEHGASVSCYPFMDPSFFSFQRCSPNGNLFWIMLM